MRKMAEMIQVGKKRQPFLAKILNRTKGHKRVSIQERFMASSSSIPLPHRSAWLLFCWYPLPCQPSPWWAKDYVGKQGYANAEASFATLLSPFPHHTTECLPITVLHIRMPPRLPQRTKQCYAKQSGILTYIAMRCTVWESGERGGGAMKEVKHDGGAARRQEDTVRWGDWATGELVGTKKGHVCWYHSYCVMTERGRRGKNRGGEGRKRRSRNKGMLALRGGTCCWKRRSNMGGRGGVGGVGKWEVRWGPRGGY